MQTLLVAALLVLSSTGTSAAGAQQTSVRDVRIDNRPWRSSVGSTIPLWPNGLPGGADQKSPGEFSRTGTNPRRFAGRPVTGVFNVTVPTLTVFKPARIRESAVILVFPGGGFQQLAIDLEGTEACEWLTGLGLTCVLVKYRVPNSNHHYDARCDCGVTPRRLTALEDAQRAIRTVRAYAREWGINPHKVGVLGFSAGGYLVAQTSNITRPIYPPRDAIDRVSERPDVAIALYPGHLCRDGRHLEPGIRVTHGTSPTFLLHSRDDPTDPVCNSIVYARALNLAKVSNEVHLFTLGGHAFGLRETGTAISRWPVLVEAWLRRQGML